jgi:hypothetical protein
MPTGSGQNLVRLGKNSRSLTFGGNSEWARMDKAGRRGGALTLARLMLPSGHVENIAASCGDEEIANRSCHPCGSTRPVLLLPESAIGLMASFPTD